MVVFAPSLISNDSVIKSKRRVDVVELKNESDLTRFNKIAIQGTPQMAVD